MRLIRLHIDNFGGLHDYDYQFEDGLNVILEDNGWGKTTMAAFLKAMLYGFDAKRSRDITENERKRYLPWQGGAYGGSLEFEAGGVHYRIERTFGATPRFDKVKITNAERGTTARIDPDKIGETFFGLDASAFQRSVFINQNGLSIDGAAGSIHARLNALVSQANDAAAYDGAVERLTQQIKFYEKTGGRGRLGDLTREIAALERTRDGLEDDIARQDRARERIVELDALMGALNKELEAKKRELEAVSGETKKHEADRERLQELDAQIAGLNERLRAVRAELGGQEPEQAQIDEAKRREQEADALQDGLKQLEAERGELAAGYEKLLAPYGGTLPTAAQLDEIQKLGGELQGLSSAGTEEPKESGALPEGYEAVKAAAAAAAAYPERLAAAVGSQAELDRLSRLLESQENGLVRESEDWAGKKRRYEAAAAEEGQLRAELEGQKQYAPEMVGPVISGLESLQRQERELTEKKASQEEAIRRETADWAVKRERFGELQARVEAEKAQAGDVSGSEAAQAAPAIKRLEKILMLQRVAEVTRDSLAGLALTPQEEAALAANGGELPTEEEGAEILGRFRNAARLQGELQGVSARLEGEKSKADSLVSSIDQLEAGLGAQETPVEEPKQPAGAAFIGAGAALVVLGVILGVMVSPFLAAVSAVGAVLIAVGAAGASAYKTKLQAYEVYRAMAEKRRETERKRDELQEQLQKVHAAVEELEAQAQRQQHELEAEETAVSEWFARFAPAGTELSERAITQVIGEARELRGLREQKEKFEKEQRGLQEQLEAIQGERAAVEAQYPQITGETTEGALEKLRLAQTDARVREEKLAAAVRALEDFLAGAKLTKEQMGADQSPYLKTLKDELSQTCELLQETTKSRAEYESEYPEIVGLSCDDALALLRGKQSAYEVAAGRLSAASKNAETALQEAGAAREELLNPCSPRLAALEKEHEETKDALAQALAKANEALGAIGLTAEARNAKEQLERAGRMLDGYRRQEEKQKESRERRERSARQVRELRERLEKSCEPLCGRFAGEELMKRLALVRGEINEAARLREKLAEAEKMKSSRQEQLTAARKAVEAFIAKYGHFEPGQKGVIAEIRERTDDILRLTAALRQLNEQRAPLAKAAGNAAREVNERELELGRRVAELEKRRDELLVEYTQKGEFIRRADQLLERYPDVEAQLGRLYEQKQKAQAELVTLKRAIALLGKAKANLADRYLSKVEQLFNNYLRIWLGNSAVRGILDLDFQVTIEENDEVHVAEGYSTGYCDLIDFCMRLALVDTLFEGEKPFLILDDPFVNLDAERLDRAMELLSVMAADKQLVYFVCHPVRAARAQGMDEAQAEFARQARAARLISGSRENAAKKPEMRVRKSPRELYHVVGDGVCALRPVKPNYTITNNIFSLSFVVNEEAARKDVVYELFFIDAKGRVLNDRQLVELRGGKLSAERVQFCLNTRDDGGDQYELMIRESGQGDYEVVARIPYRAKLSFTGTDSFGF